MRVRKQTYNGNLRKGFLQTGTTNLNDPSDPEVKARVSPDSVTTWIDNSLITRK